MNDTIAAEIITGIVTVLVTFFTVLAGILKSRKDAEIRQAVTDEKIEELTREVREHNNFARRLPVVENDIKTLYKKVERLEK